MTTIVDPAIAEVISRHLVELRGEDTIAMAASKTGLNRKTWIDLEISKNHYPSFENLRKLSDYYGVSIDWIVGRSKTKDPRNESITESIGLSESAVNSLRYLQDTNAGNKLMSLAEPTRFPSFMRPYYPSGPSPYIIEMLEACIDYYGEDVVENQIYIKKLNSGFLCEMSLHPPFNFKPEYFGGDSKSMADIQKSWRHIENDMINALLEDPHIIKALTLFCVSVEDSMDREGVDAAWSDCYQQVKLTEALRSFRSSFRKKCPWIWESMDESKYEVVAGMYGKISEEWLLDRYSDDNLSHYHDGAVRVMRDRFPDLFKDRIEKFDRKTKDYYENC